MDAIHLGLDIAWLFTAIAVMYLGFDAHRRLSHSNMATTISKSMIVAGSVFLLLAAFHAHEDLLGATVSPALHLVPLLVLGYASYEYRRLLRGARSAI